MESNIQPQSLLTEMSQSIIANLPHGIAVHKIIVDENNLPIDYIFLDVNQKFEEFTGLKKENIINKKVTEAIPGIKEAQPDLISIYGKVALTGEGTNIEIYFKPLNRWYSISAYSPQKDYFVAIFSDITKRKEAEMTLQSSTRALKAISTCNQVIIQGKNEKEMVQKICDEIVKVTGYMLVWVGYAENDAEKTVKHIGVAGFEDGFLNEHITWADNEQGKRPISIAIRSGEIYRCQDIANFQTSADWKIQALKRGYGSGIALPLDINGTKGALVIFAKEKDAFDDNEMKLLTELAKDLSFGINAVRTKQKEIQVEQALRESEEKFAKAFRSSPIALSLSGIKDRILLEANHAFEEMTGYSIAECIGKAADELNIYPYPNEREQIVETMKTKGQIRNAELHIRHKSGEIRTVLVFAEPITIGNSQYVLSATEDITELKKAEAIIHSNEQELLEAQRIGHFGNFDWDAKADTIKWSAEYYHIYGFDPQQKPPGYVEHLKTYSPESAAKLDVLVKKSMQTGKPYEVDLEQVRPDGTTKWITARGEVKRDENNKIIGLRGTAQDITDRKLAEGRLKELDSIKSRFIRVVSHQLRTPLSAIRWQIETLLNETSHLSELQKQLLHESYRANLEIISTINDLTTALDIEEGRAVHLDKIPNSLLSLWEAMEQSYIDKCRTKNITLEIHKPQGVLPLIEMDTEKIRTVIEKLTDNALTYTKEKGKIIISFEKIDNLLRFKISDTGVGIPKNEKAYIFTRFYRGSNASVMKPDAAGLGLYIAKNFVDSHGGKIGFTSEEGAGSTFWLELPLTSE